MIRHFFRTLALTLATFLIGGLCYYQSGIEIHYGLDSLFQLRGVRPPPSEVVIVALDEKSEDRLGVFNDYKEWRGFHTKLVQELKRQGAKLVVFDLNFIISKPDVDPALASAIKESGNVLMTECIAKIDLFGKEFSGREECSKINSKAPVVENRKPVPAYRFKMERHLPTSDLKAAALDHAPFYLPDDDNAQSPTIYETWTFINRLEETPTLPVLAWLHFLNRSGQLDHAGRVDLTLSEWIASERRKCLSGSNGSINENTQNSVINQRIHDLLCDVGDSQYIDYYGPPKTLRMLSYSDVYEGKGNDLEDKIVFIGKANLAYISGKITDTFPTPFTNNASGQMFGVEIMATQFANLLEGRHITSPLPPLLFLLFFSVFISVCLSVLPGLKGMTLSVLIAGIYATTAWWCFGHFGWWLPIVIPLAIQLPLSWLLSLFWLRHDLLKERNRIIDFIYQGFPEWLHIIPASPGQWHPEQSARKLGEGREVFGVCLATDIQGYTPITSHLPSREVWKLLEAYYHALGQPVSSNNGIIANVQGDAMIAMWIDLPVNIQRQAACMAALEIVEAVGMFNSTDTHQPLPTRIGLYEGDFLLASGDAGKFRYFNPFGNTINTASRIEGVNKYLGTKILATKAIVQDVAGITCRPVGKFLLVGLDDAVELVEIMNKVKEPSALDDNSIASFVAGLDAYQAGRWQEALTIFQQLIASCDDGPSRFYLNLVTSHLDNPPSEWEGTVQLKSK